MGYIYALCENEEIRYIGQTTKKPELRLRQHLSSKQKSHLRNWLNKLQQEHKKPILKILVVEPNETLDAKETICIAYYRYFGARLVNSANGGKVSRGMVRSAEYKKLKSIAAKNAYSRDITLANRIRLSVAKLNWQQVNEIRAKESLTQQKIASMYNVSRETIRDIRGNKTWKM